jgi:multiple sugar transport system ATP-binding protein
MATVRLKNIHKNFNGVSILKGIDLEVNDGEFCVFVGPSGCGKSTLLRIISGLEDATDGSIEIGGKDVTKSDPIDRGIAMVFQSYALYPHLTVRDNIGFGLSLAKRPKSEITERVNAAAKMLQLESLLDRKPKDLSGGQRQRVAIGRAIVREPEVFLFDEPLSNLDAALRSKMRIELTELHSTLNATMIYVTHDQIEAMTMADKIVVLNAGHIEQVGSPMELYHHPKTPFVAGFIGSPKMNLFDGTVAKEHNADLYGIRPEHLTLSLEEGKWKGVIKHIEHLGADVILHINVADLGTLVARADGDFSAGMGSTIYATPQEGKEHVF